MDNNTAENTGLKVGSVMDALDWRSAIKKFDPSKKVSDLDLSRLVQAANLAPSSGGLQPFRLIVIGNQELKAKLQPASYGQPQVGDSSHLFVFAVQSDFGSEIVDTYAERMAEVRGLEVESLAGMKQSLNGFVSSLPVEKKQSWAARQAYISLGFVIATAAIMQIDTCPMEGFDPQQYSEILGLEAKGLMPVVILPVGYRAAGDPFADLAKVRKKEEDFVLRFD